MPSGGQIRGIALQIEAGKFNVRQDDFSPVRFQGIRSGHRGEEPLETEGTPLTRPTFGALRPSPRPVPGQPQPPKVDSTRYNPPRKIGASLLLHRSTAQRARRSRDSSLRWLSSFFGGEPAVVTSKLRVGLPYENLTSHNGHERSLVIGRRGPANPSRFKTNYKSLYLPRKDSNS